MHWARAPATRSARTRCGNAAEARACEDELLRRLIRIWLANRGVWEAIIGAGPVVPVPAEDEDVERYLSAWSDLLDELTR